MIAFAQTFAWQASAELAGFLAAGFVLGFAHFGALWHHARQLVEGTRWWRTVTLAAARFALLLSALTLASLQGAPALLATTLGLLCGRALVMRRFGRTAG